MTVSGTTVTTGNGGFGYLSTATTGKLTLESISFTTSTAPLDGGLVYFGGTNNVEIVLTAPTITSATAT